MLNKCSVRMGFWLFGNGKKMITHPNIKLSENDIENNITLSEGLILLFLISGAWHGPFELLTQIYVVLI